jgi:GNAT superfamily N-acetyltransferase
MTDAPEAGIEEAIVGPLLAFNEAHAGPRHYLPLVITVAHPDTGEILGGLWGGTSYGYLHIELLSLPEQMRGIGFGRQMMLQAEREAAWRGCHAAWLDTFSFQARGFYERLGYEVFGTLNDYPPGHQRFFMTKALGTKA